MCHFINPAGDIISEEYMFPCSVYNNIFIKTWYIPYKIVAEPGIIRKKAAIPYQGRKKEKGAAPSSSF